MQHFDVVKETFVMYTFTCLCITCLLLYNLGGQSCIDTPNINQRGSTTIGNGRQVIVPNARFGCNGRVTAIRASLRWGGGDGDLPSVQIWHPTSLGSSVYIRSGQVQVTTGQQMGPWNSRYYSTSVSLNNNDYIEFQLNDVLGYYQPTNPRRRIWSIQASEYISYSNNVNSPGDMIDITSAPNVETERQPLIEVMYGKNCIKNFVYYLSMPKQSIYEKDCDLSAVIISYSTSTIVLYIRDNREVFFLTKKCWPETSLCSQ